MGTRDRLRRAADMDGIDTGAKISFLIARTVNFSMSARWRFGLKANLVPSGLVYDLLLARRDLGSRIHVGKPATRDD